MNKKLKWFIAVILCIVVFIGIYFLYGYLKNHYEPQQLADDQSSEQSASAHLAPDFTVTDSAGNQVKLSNYFGKPIVLNFWASWCYYCKVEMPDFETAYKKYPDVQFLMVNITDGHQETKQSAADFIADSGFTFPVLYDEQLDAAKKYGTNSLPMTVFIDKNGELVTYANGKLSLENLEKAISMIK